MLFQSFVIFFLSSLEITRETTLLRQHLDALGSPQSSVLLGDVWSSQVQDESKWIWFRNLLPLLSRPETSSHLQSLRYVCHADIGEPGSGWSLVVWRQIQNHRNTCRNTIHQWNTHSVDVLVLYMSISILSSFFYCTFQWEIFYTYYMLHINYKMKMTLYLHKFLFQYCIDALRPNKGVNSNDYTGLKHYFFGSP